MVSPLEQRFIQKIEHVRHESSIRNVEEAFTKQRQLGQGTYGQVYLATDNVTGEEVALKKIKLEASKEKREGFPITAIREIRVLMTLEHENVVKLKEIVRSNMYKKNDFKGYIYLVFEYMQHDLSGLHERMGKVMDPAMAKSFIKQTLEGLAYCHSRSVLHRDMKSSNLLIDNDGVLKLADFGLARPHISADGSDDQLTFQVCTLWYRPPELFLGCQQYGGEVDVWSSGCILFELLAGVPLFAGKKDVDMLDLIWNRLGHPTPEVWPGAEKLQYYHCVKMNPVKRTNSLRQHCEQHRMPPEAIDLLEQMLQLDPSKRPTVQQCLEHPYFSAHPPPMTRDQFRRFAFEASHEYIVKGKDKRNRMTDSDEPEFEAPSKQRAEAPPIAPYTHAPKPLAPPTGPPPLSAAPAPMRPPTVPAYAHSSVHAAYAHAPPVPRQAGGPAPPPLVSRVPPGGPDHRAPAGVPPAGSRGGAGAAVALDGAAANGGGGLYGDHLRAHGRPMMPPGGMGMGHPGAATHGQVGGGSQPPGAGYHQASAPGQWQQSSGQSRGRY